MPVPAVPAATHFGALPGGQTVEAYRLSNPLGMSVTVLTYGGIVQTIEVPDARGERRNVALGFARLEDYLVRSPYFGAIIGRVANRIAAGRFQIDGVTHSVPLNDAPRSLHGGMHGFHTKLWAARAWSDEGPHRCAWSMSARMAKRGTPGIFIPR